MKMMTSVLAKNKVLHSYKFPNKMCKMFCSYYFLVQVYFTNTQYIRHIKFED